MILLTAISSSATTLSISPDASLPAANGVILIGTEIIIYDTNYMGTLYGCVRGANSTSAATHAVGAAVSLIDFSGGDAQTVTGLIVTGGTASTALTLDSNKALASSSTTGTELGYVHGVTSAIQTQLNAKFATASFTDAAVTAKVLTGFTSGAGVITVSDSLLSALDKLDGNVGTKLNLSGGILTGALSPWSISSTTRDALFAAAVPSGTITYGTPTNGSTIVITGLPTDGPQTFTKVAAIPAANQFSTIDELTALLDGLTDLSASANTGVITLVAVTHGTAMNAVAITGTASYSALNRTFSGGTQPAKGTLIYNTSTDKLNVFTTLWEVITSA